MLFSGQTPEDPLREANEFECRNMFMDFDQVVGYKTFINSDQLFGKYLEMGFDNFKIEGRIIDPANVIESYG